MQLSTQRMLENDRSKMEERIQAAETALNERKREFDLNQGGTTEENKAIEAALRGLSRMRVDGPSWLEWQQLKLGHNVPEQPGERMSFPRREGLPEHKYT
jgi:hypothetical protein